MSERVDLEHVRALIDQSGYTYQEIASGSGVSVITISRIMKGSGAQSGTLSQLATFLAPSVPGELPPDETSEQETIHREAVILILRQSQAQIALLRRLARQRLRWIIVLAVVLAAVVCWFLWDLTHPEIGLIRLKQSGYILGQLLGLAGR